MLSVFSIFLNKYTKNTYKQTLLDEKNNNLIFLFLEAIKYSIFITY